MATFRATLMTTIKSDVTLTTLLTGGIYDANDPDFPPEGLSPAQGPDAAFDSYGAVKPTAVVRFRGAKPYGPHYEEGSEREFVEIYLYQDTGVSTIESALARLKALLDRALLTDDNGVVRLKWAGNQGELPADEVGGANCSMCRIEAVKMS